MMHTLHVCPRHAAMARRSLELKVSDNLSWCMSNTIDDGMRLLRILYIYVITQVLLNQCTSHSTRFCGPCDGSGGP